MRFDAAGGQGLQQVISVGSKVRIDPTMPMAVDPPSETPQAAGLIFVGMGRKEFRRDHWRLIGCNGPDVAGHFFALSVSSIANYTTLFQPRKALQSPATR